MPADIEAERRSVTEQAAHWYVRCTGEPLTLYECKEMAQWLEASPEHGVELVNMFGLDDLLLLRSHGLQRPSH